MPQVPREGSGLWALLQVVPGDGEWQDLMVMLGRAMKYVDPAFARTWQERLQRKVMLQGYTPKERTLAEAIEVGRIYAVRDAVQRKTWFELDDSKRPTKIRRVK